MNSIQRQLSTRLAFGMLALLVLTATLAAINLRHELEEGFDSSLEQAAQRLLLVYELSIDEADLPSTELRNTGETADGLTERYRMHDLLLSYEVKDKNGIIFMRSQVANDDVFPERFTAGYQNREEHRLYATRAEQSGVSIVVAEPMAHRSEALWETLAALAIPLLLLIPLSLWLVRYVVNGSIRSVSAVREQIEMRGGGNLQPIEIAGLPDELRPIAESVNDMMDRLGRALDAERSFATHSAHELRTPIASALNQIQRQVACLPAGAEQVRAQQIEITLRNLARTSEKLMQLSRAESGFLVSPYTYNVYPIIELVVAEFRSNTGVGHRLVLDHVAQPVLITRLDEDGFGILLRNLIENAIKHGEPDSEIRLIVDSEHNSLRLINACDTVTDVDISKLRLRFVRGDTTASGSGLGLAIVDSLASRAGIHVSYFSPVRDQPRGFEVVVDVGLA